MGGAPLETASPHHVDPDGSVITPDDVLIVNETFGNRCTAFDVTADGREASVSGWPSS